MLTQYCYFEPSLDYGVRFVLDQYAWLDFYSASSVTSLRVDMSVHLDTLSWFRLWFYSINAACLSEKKQLTILYSLVLLDRGLNPWRYT